MTIFGTFCHFLVHFWPFLAKMGHFSNRTSLGMTVKGLKNTKKSVWNAKTQIFSGLNPDLKAGRKVGKKGPEKGPGKKNRKILKPFSTAKVGKKFQRYLVFREKRWFCKGTVTFLLKNDKKTRFFIKKLHKKMPKNGKKGHFPKGNDQKRPFFHVFY